jgi:hypothetical protein
MELEYNPQPGAGILDIKWESPHEFLSGGYDASLRIYDIRWVLWDFIQCFLKLYEFCTGDSYYMQELHAYKLPCILKMCKMVNVCRFSEQYTMRGLNL